MKQQLPATNAVPVVAAAAAIACALLLLPGGGGSVRSADVAPALRLVAGDVAAVVQSPARSATKAQPKSAVSHSTGVAVSPVSTLRSSPPVHHRAPVRRAVSRGPASPTHVVNSTSVKPPVLSAPRVITQSAKHGNGKAKALGHLKKAKAKAVGHGRKTAPYHVASHAAHGVKARGAASRAAPVSHGSPAVPPGQQKKAAGGQGASSGRGGGR
jgi:hypothetical protein